MSSFALSSYRLRATSGDVNVIVTYFGPSNSPILSASGTVVDGARKNLKEATTNTPIPGTSGSNLKGTGRALITIDNICVIAPAYAADGTEIMGANEGETLAPGTYVLGEGLDGKFVAPATPIAGEKTWALAREPEAKAVSTTPLRILSTTNWTDVAKTTNWEKPRKLIVANMDAVNGAFVAISSGIDNNNKVSTSAGIPIPPSATILDLDVPAGTDVFIVRAAGSGNVLVQEFI